MNNIELKPGDFVTIKDDPTKRLKMIFKGIVNGEAVCLQVSSTSFDMHLLEKMGGEVSEEIMEQIDVDENIY
jgi:hypothetical protein